MGQVAHDDDEVAVVPDLADVAEPQPGQRQAVALRGGDGTWIDRRRRVRSGRYRRVRSGRYRRDGAGWPSDLGTSVPARLLRPQDSDPLGELVPDRLQAGKT